MEDFIQIDGYTLSQEPTSLLENVKEQNALEESYYLANARRPRERDLRKVIQFAEKHPDRPQFKNYVVSLAKRLGRWEVVDEYRELTAAQHPDYLFGKIEQAAQALEKEEIEKVPVFLGKNLELRDLYPEKEVFHVSEFEHFEYTVIRYLAKTGNLEAAESRYDRLKAAGCDSPLMDFVREQLDILALQSSLEAMLEAREKMSKASSPQYVLPPQRKEAPTLTHPELLHLFEERGKVSAASLAPLLALPRESLIRDLAAIVEDCVYRYRHFEERYYKEDYIDDRPFSALAMLCELDAGEAGLKPLLFLLSQDEDVLEFWLGDSLTEDLWRYVYDLGQHSLPLLFEFFQKQKAYEFSYSPIRSTIEQLLLHQPEKKAEIVKMIGETLRKLTNRPLLRKVNPVVATTLASLCLTFHLVEFEQELKIFYEAELVDTWQMGSWEDYIADLHDENSPVRLRKEKITPPLKRFDQLLNSWKSVQEQYKKTAPNKQLSEKKLLNEYGIPFKRESVKIGRNDPCPCGSGKKYKQCCLKK